uniref:Si:dkey-25g12.4 n=1 Tax=Cynoglossus semilaevis TaxID=244447 RepID=A0A3P8UKB6_CYNSE
TRSCDLPQTKTITVYRNGDAFFPGRKVVVNPRHVLTFDTFLTSLTKAIGAPFGAVRKLYTPHQGRKVCCLEELKHGGAYVAAGNEHFKKLDRIVVSARWKKSNDETCMINVLTNGELLTPPARIRIPKYTLKNWENVLAMVTEKVRLRTGAVHRLCTLDGRPVCSSTELENNRHYVAVGAERFKVLPYDLCIPGFSISDSRTFQRYRTFVIVTNTPYTEFPEMYQDRSAVREKGKKTEMAPAKGSVFDAPNKRHEVAGAAEVQEELRLKVELPIDQVKTQVCCCMHFSNKDILIMIIIDFWGPVMTPAKDPINSLNIFLITLSRTCMLLIQIGYGFYGMTIK